MKQRWFARLRRKLKEWHPAAMVRDDDAPAEPPSSTKPKGSARIFDLTPRLREAATMSNSAFRATQIDGYQRPYRRRRPIVGIQHRRRPPRPAWHEAPTLPPTSP
jgi:hypothetical protein